MRAVPMLVAASLAATALLALAPVTEARGFCVTQVDAGCPGVVCTKYDHDAGRWTQCVPTRPPIECVQEPCPGPWTELLP